MTEKRFAILLVIAASLRVFFDVILMGVPFWGNFFNFFYMAVLYFSVVSFVHYAAVNFFKVEVVDTKQYFFGYAPYWLLMFPAVPIITYFTGSNYRMHIEVFKYIPTFMVNDNYLPSGMLYIIPLMFASFVLYTRNNLKLAILPTLALLAIAFTADYLALYQWFFRFGYYLQEKYSLETFLSIYGLIMLAWGAPFCYYAYKQAGLSKYWAYAGFFAVYTLAFLALYKIGAYYMA